MTTKQEHDDVLLKMIIADLGSIAPVSPKEEKRLITVMVEGQLAAKCLIQASNLSPKICEQLIEKERAGSAARRRLIETNGRLVISIAKKYTRPGLSLTDLCQEGMLGLIRAIDGFDRKKGERLSTYASYWIKQKISEAVRKESHEQQALSLEEPLYDDSTTLTDILEDESGRSLEEMTDFTLLKHEIDYVLASLTDKDVTDRAILYQA